MLRTAPRRLTLAERQRHGTALAARGCKAGLRSGYFSSSLSSFAVFWSRTGHVRNKKFVCGTLQGFNKLPEPLG